MSRWTANFEAHAFQPIWRELKDEIDKSKIDDHSVLSSVQELARLKKVISYVDKLLQALDPELIPAGIWDSFYQQAAECLSQVRAFSQNRNLGHIQNANTYADNLLGYVRPYVVSPDRAARAYAQAFKDSSEEIRKHAESVNNSIQDIAREVEESKHRMISNESTATQLSREIEVAFEKICGNNGLESEIDSIVERLKSKYSQAEILHGKLFESNDNEESISSQVENAKNESVRILGEINSLGASASGIVQDLQDAHEQAFGVKNESGVFVGGIKSEYDFGVQKYQALNQKVEDLLPGATSAALASSYKIMRDSFDIPIRNATLLFYSSIVLLIVASVFFSIKLSFEPFSYEFTTPDNWLGVMQGLASRVPVYGPLIWLAYFASKRRSEYQRLQQEYAHKQALATSFESYKKQVVELGEKENPLLSHLLKKAVDAVAYNACETLDKKHGDRMPLQELAEKFIDEIAKTQKFSKD